MSPQLFNATPFAFECFLQADAAGQLFLSAVLCATFAFDESGTPYAVADQEPLPAGDEFFGAPGHSSVRRDSCATPAKRFVDLVVDASAYAPSGIPVGELMVGVRVGAWSKLLSVCGDRHWVGVASNRPSAPQPFLRLPMRYESAYGGSIFDKDGKVTDCYPANPVGVGYRGARAALSGRLSELPNIESPEARLTTRGHDSPVAGFGVIARNWAPRVRFSGTYDEDWLARRSPLLPVDFDERFHQCAPLDQQFTAFPAGEATVLRNLTPEGRWQFRMPVLDPPLTLLLDDEVRSARLRVDTVTIDAERKRVSLIARHCLHDLRQMGRLREIIVGRPTSAWLRSRVRGKRYLGHSEPLPRS